MTARPRRGCLQSGIPSRSTPSAWFLGAALAFGLSALARAEEAASGARPGDGEPRLSVESAYATQSIADGQAICCFVEGVLLRFPGMEIECRSLVAWGDAARLPRALGSLGTEPDAAGTGGGPAPAAGPTPGPAPAAPAPADAGRASSALLGRLHDRLNGVLFALYAEGDVRFRMGEQTVRCERLYVDFRRRHLSTGRVTLTRSVMLPARGRAVPLVVRAERMREATGDTLVLEDATYTTCDFEDPHYRFRCTEFQITEYEDHTTFTAWNNVVDYGGIPLFYLPVLGGRSDLSARPLRSVSYARSSRFGHEIDLVWGDDVVLDGERWGEWRFHTDFRSRRGPGGGPDLEYRTADYEGDFRAYYARDEATSDRFDGSAVPRRDRGRVRWEHRHRLGDGWRLDLSLFDFSDRNFQREYLKREALRERDPENYVSLRHAGGTDLFSITAQRRLDRFATATEALPGVAFHRIGYPAMRRPFPLRLLDDLTWSADASGGVYERAYDGALGIRSEDQWRGDVLGRLEGVKGLGPVRVTPFFTAGTTYHAGGEFPDGADHRRRGDLAAGVRATVEARRDYPSVESAVLALDGLRHVVGLDALWYRRFAVSRDPSAYVPLDATETVDTIRATELRLRQRWQTERAGRRVDWVDLEVRGLHFAGRRPTGATPLLFREEAVAGGRFSDLVGEEKYRARPLRGPWGPYEADLRVRLRENLFLIGEGEYDPYDRAFATAALGLRWFVLPKVSLYVGDRRIRGDSDIYTLRADWAVSERWSLGISQQADLRDSDGLETEVRVRRVLHDFVIEMGFVRDRASNDRSIHLSVIPVALWDPPTSGGQGRRLDFEAQRWYR